jgi:hypothetical protein
VVASFRVSLISAGWSHDFASEKADLVASGRNPYFILEPGYVLVLKDSKEKDGKEQLTITVTEETKKVDGVECGVVEESDTIWDTRREKVVACSNKYVAISKRTNTVYYLGTDAGGAWLSGENGAKFGLIMPGRPLVGERHYQEVALKVAMDRAEIVSVSATVKTLGGEFKNCLKVEESTPLDPGKKEDKYYAPGIGLVQQGLLKLVKHRKSSK